MGKSRPIATDVEIDEEIGGAWCRICFTPVYADKIESGPRIGTRITFRHVTQHPPCLDPKLGRVLVHIAAERETEGAQGDVSQDVGT